jgi:hypothetical protein
MKAMDKDNNSRMGRRLGRGLPRGSLSLGVLTWEACGTARPRQKQSRAKYYDEITGRNNTHIASVSIAGHGDYLYSSPNLRATE